MSRNPMAWKGKGKHYGKKETVWGWDGSLNRPSHYRARFEIVDDFGSLLVVRRCSRCRSWKPEDPEFFGVKVHHAGVPVRWDPHCKPCRAARRKQQWQAKPKDERAAHYKARWRRMKVEEEKIEARRAYNAEQQRKWRANHPEVARDVAKRYRARLKSDPKRWAEELEKRRMAHRLRRERAGLPIRPVESRSDRDHLPYVPVEPLALFLEGEMRRLDVDDPVEHLCATLGLEVRTFNDWRAGRRTNAQFDVVDRVLVNGGLNWWDVYEERTLPANGHASGRPEDVLRYIKDVWAYQTYEAARLAFEGELVE